jgi:hypothetical protein
MAFTQKHVDALNEAMASGELEVNFGDRKVRYRSFEELKRAKQHIQKELQATAKKGSIRTYQVNVSKL